MEKYWIIAFAIGCIWLVGCIADFVFIRPKRGKKTSWIEIVIAIFVGLILVAIAIPCFVKSRNTANQEALIRLLEEGRRWNERQSHRDREPHR